MEYPIYTDLHDINDDTRTIVDNGGCWWMNSLCGVFYRSLDSDARFVIHEIASRLSIRMACYFTHTDGHDIDEDIRAISGHGGSWPHGLGDGMFCRFLQVPPSMPVSDIASRLSLGQHDVLSTRTGTISMKKTVLLLIMVVHGLVMVCLVVCSIDNWLLFRLRLLTMSLLGQKSISPCFLGTDTSLTHNKGILFIS